MTLAVFTLFMLFQVFPAAQKISSKNRLFLGTIGGIASVFYSLSLKEHDYGSDWVRLFPAMANGRSGIGQAVAQVAAMAATIGISCIGGLFTGLIMRAAGRFQFRKASYQNKHNTRAFIVN